MVQHSWQQLNSMTADDLKKLRSKLRSSTLRRIRSMIKAGVGVTPATAGITRQIKKGIVPKISTISSTGKPRKPHKPHKPSKVNNTAVTKTKKIPAPKIKKEKKSDIVRQIMEYEKFLNAKTSTVRGAKNFETNMSDRLGPTYANASNAQKTLMWKLYEEIRDSVENARLDSDRIQKDIVERFISKGYTRLTSARIKEVREILDNVLEAIDDPFTSLPKF